MANTGFLKLAEERYSCRAFEKKPVPEELVQKILEAARLAPSAVNRQPVKIWIARRPEVLEKLATTTKYLFDAPLVFVVAGSPSQAWVSKIDGKNRAETDACIAATHLMMEIQDLGLGSCWVGSFDAAAVKAMFPKEMAGWDLVALFPTGYPAAGPSPRHIERKTMEEFAEEL